MISCVWKDDYEFVTLAQRHGATNYRGMQLLWQPCDGRACGACSHCVVSIRGEQMWRFINMHSSSVDSLRRVWWYPSLTLFLCSSLPSSVFFTLSLPHCLSLMHFLPLFPFLSLLFLFMSHSSLSFSFILFPVFYLYHCMQHAMPRKPLDITLNTTCAAEWNLWASFVLITIAAGIGRALKCNLALLLSFHSLSIR